MRIHHIFAFALCAIAAAACTAGKTITVDAGDYDRQDCLASVSIPENFKNPQLTDESGNIVDCQAVDEGNRRVLYFKIDGSLPAGTRRTYALTGAKGGRTGSRMGLEDDGSSLTLTSDGREMLSYQYAVNEPQEGVRRIFARSGFLHPVKTPSGYVVTNLRPDDHYHHFGIWNPWTRVIHEGKMYDLWNIGDSLGTVRARSVDKMIEGKVVNGFDASLDHVIYTPAGEVDIFQEEWRVRATETPDGFLWNFDSDLFASSDQPLVIQAYRYQGFCLRATADWTKETCTIRSSEGLDRNEIDGTRARWIYVNGNAGGRKAGILMMTNPQNHNYPEHLRIWDETQNAGRGDVMINICPAKFEDWVIEPHSSTTLRYSVLTYDGEMTPERAERIWTDFAYPPVITIE